MPRRKAWGSVGVQCVGLFVVFEENGYVMEGVGETPAEDEVGVCIEAAWKGIMRERVGVLSPQGERG